MKLAINRVDWTNDGNISIVHLFGRDENNERKHLEAFVKPYYYVRANPQIGKPTFFSFLSQPLVKEFGKLKELQKSKKKDISTWEADVPLDIRYLIDQEIKCGVDSEYKLKPIEMKSKLRLLYIDIETLSKTTLPDSSEPICSIAAYDNYTNCFTIFYLNPFKERNVDLQRHDVCLKPFPLASENFMLKDFLQYIRKTDPDIIVGWNVRNFDIRYILNRMAKLGVSYSSLSPIKQVNPFKIQIKGRTVFDLLTACKQLIGELESYSLDFVARKEIGEGKIRLEKSIFNTWREDPKKLLEYNLRDVELLKKINEKYAILDFYDELRTFIGCNFEDCLSRAKMVDIILLRYAHSKRIILPSSRNVDSKGYEGGYVENPVRGLYESVVVLDLKSLYPSIIIGFNISPETLDPKGENVVDKDHKFSKKKIGILPSVLKEWMDLREEKRRMIREATDKQTQMKYEREERVLKALINSFYGVIGYSKFRLYDKKVVEAITMVGRETLKFTINSVRELGYNVIYADTDSVFVPIKETNLDKLEETCKKLEETINTKYDKFLSQYRLRNEDIFKVKIDAIYSKLLLIKKKRYSGLLIYKSDQLLETPILDVKGMDVKRSNSPKISKLIQEELLKVIFQDANIDGIKNLLGTTIEKIKNHEIPLLDVGVPTQVKKSLDNYKKNTIHIKAIKYSNEYLGTNFQKGSKPKWVYIKEVPSGFQSTNVIAFDEDTDIPEGFEIDWNTMIEKTVKDKVDDILDSIDLDYNKLMEEYINTHRIEETQRIKSKQLEVINASSSIQYCKG